MAYNTKPIVKDKDGNPISQYYNPDTDSYEPVEGANGANKVLVVNNDLSLIPILEKLSQLTGSVIDEETRKQNETTRQNNEQERIQLYNNLLAELERIEQIDKQVPESVLEAINALRDELGNLEDLETIDKSSIINAINEVNTKIDEIEIIDMDAENVSYDNTESGLVSNNVQTAIDEVYADLTSHKAESVYEGETHGLRIADGKLEYFDGENWRQIAGGSGSQVPLGNVVDFTAEPDDGKVILRWKDPDDIVVDGIIISKWAGTKILRKIGSYSDNENDGVLVVDSGVRNQYAVDGFIDTGLENDIEYFYMAFPYTTDGVYTSDVANRVSATPTAQKIYGIVIDETNSNPETAVTYIDDAVGFTPMKGNDGNFQWGSWEQVFNDIGIKPCVLKNGVVQYYLNPNDYTKKLDGTSADIESGNDGDVMIEFPTIHWKVNRVGTSLYVRYSTKEFEGSVCKAHMVGTTIKDKIYLPAYIGSEVSGKLRSLSGKKPTVDQTIRTFRTQAQANGEGYQQMLYYQILMLQVLYLVWFKNMDSQTALGRGYVDGNSGSIATGGTNQKGMFYGSTNGSEQNKFAGIEDFWGNVFYFIDGIYSNDNWNILISNQTTFNDTGVNYENYGQGAIENTGGYISKVQGGNETGFIIKEKDGSTTQYYVDDGGLVSERLAFFGGHWVSSDSAGAFRLNLNRTADYSYSGCGARLCFIGTE